MCVCVCVCVYVCACVYVYLYVCLCIYICVCVCVHMSMYVYLCVYMACVKSSFTNLVVTRSTATLLIGYYYNLLLRDINADLLTEKMSSAGLLRDTDVSTISSGHSIHHRNWLLLEHVRHMDVEALMTFCELLQEMWPEIGLQLITGMYEV